MNWKSRSTGYGSFAIAFHWLMLLLIIAVYASMEFKGIYPKDSAGRAAMASWHYTLGLSVFLLVWLRLSVRLSGAAPLARPAPPARQATLARVMHLALYALDVRPTFAGLVNPQRERVPVPFFGLELPALIGKSEGLAKQLKDIHETGATVGYFLVGLHAAAALFHHYVRRDSTLRLMLPGR